MKRLICTENMRKKTYITYYVIGSSSGSRGGRARPTPVRTGQKMASVWGRKFRESSGPLGQISGSATGQTPKSQVVKDV